MLNPTINEYQIISAQTAQYPYQQAVQTKQHEWMYVINALSSEAGEIGDVARKAFHDSKDLPDIKQMATSEIGDVFWYSARVADLMNVEFSSILSDTNADEFNLSDHQNAMRTSRKYPVGIANTGGVEKINYHATSLNVAIGELNATALSAFENETNLSVEKHELTQNLREVLNQATYIANLLGISLQHVIEGNLAKLGHRQEQGTILRKEGRDGSDLAQGTPTADTDMEI